jgi:hypothetical protein
LEAYRSALLFLFSAGAKLGSGETAMKLEGAEWLSKQDTIKSCKAAEYRSGEAKVKVPRGAISAEMTGDLVGWMKGEGKPGMAELAQVLFGAHARVQEVVQLKEDEVDEGVGGGFRFRNKMFRCGNGQPAWLTKGWGEVDVVVKEILLRRKRVAGKGRLLWPCAEFRIGEFRAAMKRAAEALGWGAELQFDVPHCLRHGRIAQAMAADDVEEQTKTMRSSVASLGRYGKPNAARTGCKSAKKEFGKALKKVRQARRRK